MTRLAGNTKSRAPGLSELLGRAGSAGAGATSAGPVASLGRSTVGGAGVALKGGSTGGCRVAGPGIGALSLWSCSAMSCEKSTMGVTSL